MEERQRLQASRRGHRSHLTKLFHKYHEIMDGRKNADNELDRISISNLIEQLQRKASTLRQLDDKIQEVIESPEDLESDIVEVEELHDEIQ